MAKTHPEYLVTILAAGGAVGGSIDLPTTEAAQWYLQGVRAACSLINGTIVVQHHGQHLATFDVCRLDHHVIAQCFASTAPAKAA